MTFMRRDRASLLSAQKLQYFRLQFFMIHGDHSFHVPRIRLPSVVLVQVLYMLFPLQERGSLRQVRRDTHVVTPHHTVFVARRCG